MSGGWHVRVWRRFRVAPGVTLNLSKGGLSTSLGVRHAHVTVGRRGVRQTVGIPGGTGVLFTKTTPWPANQGGQPRQTPYHAPLRAYQAPRSQGAAPSPSLVGAAAGGFLRGILWVVAALGVVAAIGALSH